MRILILGAGEITKEYVKIICSEYDNCQLILVGNSWKSYEWNSQKDNVSVYFGGYEAFFQSAEAEFDVAIVCLPVQMLAAGALQCIQYGIKCVLLEKPGALSSKEFEELEVAATSKGAGCYVAYNRRFLDSVEKLKKEVALRPINLVRAEISERSWLVPKGKFNSNVLDHWMLANTSHVIDILFYCFDSVDITCAIIDHKVPDSVSGTYLGVGYVNKDIPLCYSGAWNAPGGWAIEVLGDGFKLELKPLEALQKHTIGNSQPEILDQSDYGSYKPGFKKMIGSLINQDFSKFLTISDARRNFKVYSKIGGFNLL